jgi:3'-phosphoadenosine 5'-phosphosulfate sulfotransferase (PAPS reductase)/FAD synthetase
MKKLYTVMWFSAGVSSAVAWKLAADQIDAVFYIHIDDQEPDTLRFVQEVSQWVGTPVTILQHEKYKTVDEVCRKERYMSGIAGARCTLTLKKEVREKWERQNADKYPFQYVMGYDAGETLRMNRVKEMNPEFQYLFPLADAKMHKEEVHQVLKASGIKRPRMYKLGYQNNNCIGCIKAQSPSYWNKIRVDFPEVFKIRAELSDELGVRLVKVGDDRVSLFDLDPNLGKGLEPICDECGLLCTPMILTP